MGHTNAMCAYYTGKRGVRDCPQSAKDGVGVKQRVRIRSRVNVCLRGKTDAETLIEYVTRSIAAYKGTTRAATQGVRQEIKAWVS